MYYDVKNILERNCVFNAVIGGRGIGKTYSALKLFMENEIPHIYLRRSDTEIKLCYNKNIHPYKTLNSDLELDWCVETKGGIPSVISSKTGKTRGYGIALSTFHNIRGADFSDIEYILFDEFIRDSNSRPLKNEAMTFFNLYESINRNRELKGKQPVRVIMLSNSVSHYSEILIGFKASDTIEMMERKNQQFFTDRERSLCINLVMQNDISNEKSNTALYRIGNEEYNNFSIHNQFTDDSMYNVRKKKLVEYIPYCAYENMYIYIHKNNGEFYTCFSRADCPVYTKETKSLFKRNHYFKIKEAMISGNMIFETFSLKKDMENIMGL